MSSLSKTTGWPERTWGNINTPDIARGLVHGKRPLSVYGERDFFADDSVYIVRENGLSSDIRHTATPGPIQLNTVVNDDQGKRIRVNYLDGDLKEKSDIIVIDSVNLTSAFDDVVWVNEAYSLDGPLDNDTFGFSLESSSIQFYITGTISDPLAGIDFRSSVRRVPAGKRIMINSFYVASSSGTSDARSTVRLVTSFMNNDSFSEGLSDNDVVNVHPVGSVALQDSSETISGVGPFAVPEGEYVAFQAFSDKVTRIAAGYFGWIEDA